MIKSDRWIREMARTRRMIDPFEDGQVRSSTISYGLSSYGYDIRVADEFKIFTNVNSTVVDPKAFDPRSFVDVKGPSCLIPPNSFALARTVEYFRIPRNVMTICLGKCVTGETRVVDAETGAYRPVRDFVLERRPATLALSGGRLAPAAVTAHVVNGVRPVFRLTTRAGLTIRATAAHPFLTPDGWRPLAELEPGDHVAAASICPVAGSDPWPSAEATLAGLLAADGAHGRAGRHSFRSEDPALVEAFVDAGLALQCRVQASGRHGWTLSGRGARGGIRGRLAPSGGVRSFGVGAPEQAFRAPRADLVHFLRALFSACGTVGGAREPAIELATARPRLARDVRHLLLRFGITARLRAVPGAENGMSYRVQVIGASPVRRFAREVGLLDGSAASTALAGYARDRRARASSTWTRFASPVETWRLEHAAARAQIAHARGGGDEKASTETALLRTEGIARSARAVTTHIEWDRVYSIHPAGLEPVYDLTVPDGNSFLANDLIVHNSTYARCGIILNVTPFEPEWEGYATLEISNTTPLPAKIYADEGIAQVLFFESDEPCQVSYGDKKGKYQAQRGIVLPRVT